MTPMLDPRSPFMTALLKSQETRLVGREHIERLATAASRAEAVGLLRDTNIGAWLEGASWRNAAERDRVLWQYLAETLGAIELRRFFPRGARLFSNAYLLKYDVANIKAVLQGLALGHEPRLSPIGALHAKGRLDELAAARSREELEDVLTAAGLKRFALALRPADAASGRRARLAVNAALEGEYHRGLRHAVRGRLGGHILDAACGLMLDLTNLAVLCRLLAAGKSPAESESFVPGGNLLDAHDLRDALSHGLHELPRRLGPELYRRIASDVVAACERAESVAVIDAVIERHQLIALRGLLASTLAPAAVMAWFIVLKEIELRNVRLLLTAVEDGLGIDEVRRHLLV
jgi:vacuolar-type H+-ATPase subunit C/Vma6